MTKERKEELRELVGSNKFWTIETGELQNILEECLDFIDELQEEFSKYAGFLWAHGFLRDPTETPTSPSYEIVGTWSDNGSTETIINMSPGETDREERND